MHSILSLLLGATFQPHLANLMVLGGDLLAVATIPSVLLRRGGRPLSALSWVLGLLVLPYLGVATWWLLGRTHLTRHRRKKIRAMERLCERCPPVVEAPGDLPESFRNALPFAIAGRRWTEGVFPPAALESARVLCDGAEAFSAMESAIARAEVEVRALFYIWQPDATGRRLAELLAEKARAGVRVRILVDAVGGHAFLSAFGESLRAAGAEVVGFLPARFRPWAPTFNFRNHRKLLLLDSELAFVGGMNVGDPYALLWHDLAFELRGAVVRYLDDVFREDWFFATGNDSGACAKSERTSPVEDPLGLCVVIASGPDRDENRVHDAFFLSISHARRRVWLTTPYFIPSAALLAALRGAAQRGLDVRLVLPRANDVRLVQWASRSYFGVLLRAGARIFEFQPCFSHAKAVVVDDEFTIVGSPNADARSFRLNFELACFVHSRDLNERVADVFLRDMRSSREVTGEDLANTPRHRMLLESAAHLLSPLL